MGNSRSLMPAEETDDRTQLAHVHCTYSKSIMEWYEAYAAMSMCS